MLTNYKPWELLIFIVSIHTRLNSCQANHSILLHSHWYCKGLEWCDVWALRKYLFLRCALNSVISRKRSSSWISALTLLRCLVTLKGTKMIKVQFPIITMFRFLAYNILICCVYVVLSCSCRVRDTNSCYDMNFSMYFQFFSGCCPEISRINSNTVVNQVVININFTLEAFAIVFGLSTHAKNSILMKNPEWSLFI